MPVSILLLNGTSDPFNLYAGGEVNVGDGFRRGAVWSTDRTLKYWIKLNNCDTNNVKRYNFPDINKEDSSTVTSYTYENKSNGKKVVFVKITGGGHVFPSAGFSGWDRRILGNVNKDIDATKMISRFFNF